MLDEFLGIVRYIDDRPSFNNNSCLVKLVACEAGLETVTVENNELRFYFPWEKLHSVYSGLMAKNGLASMGFLSASAMLFLELSGASVMFHDGIYITLHDGECQDDKRVFFGTESKHAAEKIAGKIMKHLNSYHRSEK